LKAIKLVYNGKTNDSRRLMGRELKLREGYLNENIIMTFL